MVIGAAMLVGSPALGQSEGDGASRQTYDLTEEGWEQRAAVAPRSPEGRLQRIRRLLAEDRAELAEELATRWIDGRSEHPLLPEAYLLRGDAQVAQGAMWNALVDYEDLIARFPASEQYMTALEREYEIGRLFTNGLNRRLWGISFLQILPAEAEGAELLIRVQERAPGSVVGEKASLQLADHYYQSGEMDMASVAYDLFVENYPNSRVREWAMLQAIRASLARFKGPSFDQTGLIDAKQRIARYEEEFPAAADRAGVDQLVVRIDESLAQRDLETAQWYAVRGEERSEVFLLRRLIRDYPDTGAAKAAVTRLQRMGEPPVVAEPSSEANGDSEGAGVGGSEAGGEGLN